MRRCASAIGDASIIAATEAANVMDLVMFFSVAVVVLKFRCKVMAIIFRPQSLKFGNFNYRRCSYPAPEILTFNYWHRRTGVVSERQAGAQCELEPVRRPQIAVGDGAEEIDVACTQFVVYR